MGAVDLVIQVESPKSVTAGLQRIGRAGHGVGEVSRGRIFPKFRADLLECAVVAKRMRDGDIEPTVVPRNPLDVLAQQIVAMAATRRRAEGARAARHWSAAPTRSPSSRASCSTACSTCSTAATRPRSSPSCGRASSGTAWRTRSGARKGALQLAVTNAGTIPDRGLYGVHLPDGRRVGELDEEMVYEARPGQTFLLGASTWRIEEITRDRVIVTPAPGAPGAMPFWKGDGIGRPKELGRGDRRVRARGRGPRSRGARRRLRPRRARRAQPVRLPARAARRHARRAERPHDRGRALPRRDRRLAAVRAVPLRRPRALGLGARAVGPHPRRVRARVRRDLVGRRDHRPPSRRRRAAVGRPRAGRAGRDRGAGGARSCRAPRCSAPASARTPPARCCCRAPTPASARRCGSSG